MEGNVRSLSHLSRQVVYVVTLFPHTWLLKLLVGPLAGQFCLKYVLFLMNSCSTFDLSIMMETRDKELKSKTI